MNNCFIIILIVGLIALIYIWIKFRKPKKNTLLCYSGTNGGGKSFNGVLDIVSFLKISRSHWKKANRKLFPSRKYKIYKGLSMPNIYSNFPIIIGKNHDKNDMKTRKLHGDKFYMYELSKPMTNAIMFEEESIPEGSQGLIDEFSSWIDQFSYDEKFSSTLNDHIQKWRHYHGNDSHLIVIDQASSNIPLQVRRRLNQAIVCKKIKHYFGFIHILYYKCVDLTDDIKSIENIDKNDSDTDDKILKMVRFSFIKRYDDRAFSNRYYYVDKNTKNVKFIESSLKCDISLPKPYGRNVKFKNLDYEIMKDKQEGEKLGENIKKE